MSGTCKKDRQDDEEHYEENLPILLPPGRQGGGLDDEKSQIPNEAVLTNRIRRVVEPKSSSVHAPPLFKCACIWTVLYFSILVLCLLFNDDPLGGIVFVRVISNIAFGICFVDMIQLTTHLYRKVRGRIRGISSAQHNHEQERRSNSELSSYVPLRFYLLFLSWTILYNPGFYVDTFFYFKPSKTMEHIIHDLQFEESSNITAFANPTQALFIGNGYAKKFGEALEVHFDRYQHNQTQKFAYVSELNLIGNLFGDEGIIALCDALKQPFSYTETLMVGRNEYVGDASAMRLSSLIKSMSSRRRNNQSLAFTNTVDASNLARTYEGSLLRWVDMEGTSLSKNGIIALYDAIGTCDSFSYLGLSYMQHRRIPPFRNVNNSVRKSLKYLKHAKNLQEINLSGNLLNDNDMQSLVNSAIETNITSLNLWNNKIGSIGVSHLIPLMKQLKKLYMGSNRRIGDEGAMILAEALKDPETTLEVLSFFDCGITQKGKDVLVASLENNTKVTYFNFDNPSST